MGAVLTHSCYRLPKVDCLPHVVTDDNTPQCPRCLHHTVAAVVCATVSEQLCFALG